jgi:hypothetical protein
MKDKKDLFDKIGKLKGTFLIISFLGFLLLFSMASLLILRGIGFDLDCINCNWYGYIRMLVIDIVIIITSFWFALIMILPIIKRWENIGILKKRR